MVGTPCTAAGSPLRQEIEIHAAEGPPRASGARHEAMRTHEEVHT